MLSLQHVTSAKELFLFDSDWLVGVRNSPLPWLHSGYTVAILDISEKGHIFTTEQHKNTTKVYTYNVFEYSHVIRITV